MLDMYTGAIPGDDGPLRAFFTDVERWLRAAGIGVGTRDPMGKAVTGAGNPIFFILLSGFYLWIPRRWRGHEVRSVLVVDARARGKARDWNRHHALGVWSRSFPAVRSWRGVVHLVFLAHGNRDPSLGWSSASGGA